MTAITAEQQQKIAAYLATHDIPSGLGTEDAACSIAAINLALTGELTDTIPACMSQVIGRWIIRIQDAMPSEMRNSSEWKRQLPFAAGTGRQLESQRLAIALDWLWTDVLPQLQTVADSGGYGAEWRHMCHSKSADAAYAVRDAAGARAAAYAVRAAAARAAAARAAANAAADAYDARAVTLAAADAAAADVAEFWRCADPRALLAKLIAVSEGAA
jgi:hypothetical protein